MQCFKRTRNKIHKKLLKYPAYVKFHQFRVKVTARILAALLAFFDVVSPLLTFLCIKKPDIDENETTNGIM